MQCSDEHNQQLGEYLRFLRRKRDAAIAEVTAEFNETKDSRLFDDQYHVDDVVALIDGLLSVVRATMKRDLQQSAFSSVLLLKQVFEQAEERGVSLTTDLPTTEDRRLLEVVDRWDQDVHGGSSSAPPPLRARAAVTCRPSGGRALPVIGQTQDPKLVSDLHNARHEADTLQERFNRLQVQCTSALREKSQVQAQLEAMINASSVGEQDAAEVSALRAQVDDLHAQLAEVDARNQHGGSGVDALMHELHQTQDTNAQLAAELDGVRAEVDQRVERSAQFVNMRQMLAKKNSVVRQLRETLQANGIYVDDVDATDD